MSTQRHRTLVTPLTLKSFDQTGVFEGYAALFNRTDLGADVILPGAFAESLRKRGPAGVRLLYQHDPSEPIGVWEIIREDANGLFVRGRLLTDVARARDVLALMRAGALDGLSIGFKVVAASRDRVAKVRRLAKVDLWEISIVTFPMMPDARVSAVKATTEPPPPRGAEREFKLWLTRDCGFTQREAQAFLDGGLKALLATQTRAAQPAVPPSSLSAAIRRATALMAP